ncbi:ATP-binding protein [Kluyvera intermedia]|uniref:ATP-binding protein n=1 Tax=Kluyvera intermedia TaxID=61648 RepID=UPI0035252643
MSKSQSSELTGGSGFTFEGHVAGFYMSALLAEAHAPACLGQVSSVHFQQKKEGFPLDDVLVYWLDASGRKAFTSLQVKRSLTISDAKSNKDFSDIIRDSWETFKSSSLVLKRDFFGAAIDEISSEKLRDMTHLCELAKETLDADQFERRFHDAMTAGQNLKNIKVVIENLLNKHAGRAVATSEVHEFLAHFVMVKFDFMHKGAVETATAANMLQPFVASDSDASPLALFAYLVHLARSSAGSNGAFNRARLVHELARAFKLKPAASFRQHMTLLSEEASKALSNISDDINAFRIPRTDAERSIKEAMDAYCCVQIVGKPGVGKSVLLKNQIQQAACGGDVLFLKSERLSGNTWHSYAHNLGLPVHVLTELLIEIEATGTPVLFIDGIDQIPDGHRGVVEDLIHTIRDEPRLSNWKMLFTLRESEDESVTDWLSSLVPCDKTKKIVIDLLTDNEAKMLAHNCPGLRPLLFSEKSVQEIIRRPFFAKVIQNLRLPVGATVQSELELLKKWWENGGYNAESRTRIGRRQTLAQVAEQKLASGGKMASLKNLVSGTEVSSLCHDGILNLSGSRLSVDFSHDIFFEWSLFFLLKDDEDNWTERLPLTRQLPLMSRVVELLAHDAFENGQWEREVNHLNKRELTGKWIRAWLTGPFNSPMFIEKSADYHSALMANDGLLFKRMLNSMQTEKTVPDPALFELTRDVVLADRISRPSDVWLWQTFVRYLVEISAELKPDSYPDVLKVFGVWLYHRRRLAPDSTLTESVQSIVLEWLRLSESHSSIDREGDIEKSARHLLLYLSREDDVFSENYLRDHISSLCIQDNVYIDVMNYATQLANVHPALLASFCLKYMLELLPEEEFYDVLEAREAARAEVQRIVSLPESQRTHKDEIFLFTQEIGVGPEFNTDYYEQRLGLKDMHQFLLGTRRSEPFASLFKMDSREALRLLVQLSNHAITAWEQISIIKGKTPLPVTVKFPWGEQAFLGDSDVYMWDTITHKHHFLHNAYRELNRWLDSEIRQQKDIDELVKRTVCGNTSVAVLSSIVRLISKHRRNSKALLSIVTNQRVLLLDKTRYLHPHSRMSNVKEEIPPLEKMLPGWFARPAYSQSVSQNIKAFKNDLAYEFEEDKALASRSAQLLKDADSFQPYICASNYKIETHEDGRITGSFSQPLVENEENFEIGLRLINALSIGEWALKSLASGTFAPGFTLIDALEFAQNHDAYSAFTCRDDIEDQIATALTGIAAVVMQHRDEVSESEIHWASDVFALVRDYPLSRHEQSNSDLALSGFPDPRIFLCKANEVLLDDPLYANEASDDLLSMLVHPLRDVMLTAFQVLVSRWNHSPKWGWAALFVATAQCLSNHSRKDLIDIRSSTIVGDARKFLSSSDEWCELMIPEVPWLALSEEELAVRKSIQERMAQAYYSKNSLLFSLNRDKYICPWTRNPASLNLKLCGSLIEKIPLEMMLNCGARPFIVSYLKHITHWVCELAEPTGKTKQDKIDIPYDIDELLSPLARAINVLGRHIPALDYELYFWKPLLKCPDSIVSQWSAEFMTSLSTYYLERGRALRDEELRVVRAILERLSLFSVLQYPHYGSLRMPNYWQTEIIQGVFLCLRAKKLTSPVVVQSMFPVMREFVVRCGWHSEVFATFLLACQRHTNFISLASFAHLVRDIITSKDKPAIWDEFVMNNVAGFIELNLPIDGKLADELRGQLLVILDWMTEKGNKRSARVSLG